MPDATSDVLDRIDTAVDDWEHGPDAARYYAGGAPAPQEATYINDVMVEIGRRFILAWPAIVAALEQVVESVKVSRVALDRFAAAFGVRPCSLARVGCSCHPVPFPAARDYRRRTKHRNRRRR